MPLPQLIAHPHLLDHIVSLPAGQLICIVCDVFSHILIDSCKRPLTVEFPEEQIDDWSPKCRWLFPSCLPQPAGGWSVLVRLNLMRIRVDAIAIIREWRTTISKKHAVVRLHYILYLSNMHLVCCFMVFSIMCFSLKWLYFYVDVSQLCCDVVSFHVYI